MPDPKKPKFDPNKPFQEVKPKFDPNKPFEAPEEPEKESGMMGRLNSYGGAFLDPVLKIPGNILESIGIGGSAIDRGLGISDKKAEETPTYQLGKKWNDFIESTGLTTVRPEHQEEFGTKVFSGLGSVASIIATRNPEAGATQLVEQGIVKSTPKLFAQESAKIATSPTGVVAGSFAIPEFEEAKAKGLSEDDAFKVFLKNYLVNQTDAIPVEAAFTKLNKLFKGGIAKKIMSIGQGGLIEGTQEGVQQYLTNEIAKGSYDPERDPLMGVLDNVTVGGLIGMLLPAIGAAAEKASPDVKQKLLDKAAQLENKAIASEQTKTELRKALDQVSTGDPELDSKIDTEADLAAQDASNALIINPKQDAQKVRSDQEIGTKSGETAKNSGENSRSNLQQTTETRTETSNPQNQVTNEKETGTQGIPQEGEEGIQKNTNEGTQEGGVLTFDQTPEYKVADEKIRKYADQIRNINPGDDITELTKQYNEALQERDNARIEFEKKSVRPRQEKSIKMTPAEAIKHQVQTYYKGVEEGVKRGTKGKEELISKVQEAIKDSPLTTTQVNTILSKVRKTNLFTPSSISKLNAFIDKFSTDAKAAELLSDSENLQSKIKEKSKTKVESISSKIKSVAKQFSNINPSEVMDIGEYRKVADSILSGFKDPKSKDYSPLNVSQVEKFIDSHNEFQQTNERDRLREQFGFGDEVTDDEIDQLSDNPDLDEDEFYQNKEATKRQLVRDKILKIAEYSQIGLRDLQNKRLEPLQKVDLNELSDSQLVNYVRTVDNIIENDDLTNVGNIEAITKAVNALKELEQRVGSAKGELGKFKGAVYNMPMLFNAMYSNSKQAALVQKYSGLQDVYNSGSKVEGAEHKLYDDFRNKAKEIKEKTGQDPLTADTQVRLGLFAPLVRFPKGAKGNEVLKQSKNIVEESIRRLKKKKDREQLALDAERLYKPFKDAESIDEVKSIMNKVDPAGYQMWEFFNQKFENEVKDKLASTSEEVYNNPFVEEENYTPKAFERIDSALTDLEDSSKSAFNSENPNKPKQAKTAIKATNTLGQGKALNFEFYNNMFRKYRESMYDIETSKPRLLFREFMKLPKAAELLGGLENKQQIVENYRKSEEIQRGIGKDYSDAAKIVDEVTGTLRTLGYTAALGSVDQFVKQYVPVATNTIWNLGGDAGLFFSHIPKDVKLFDMYTIGQRGKRMGGVERGESIKYKIQSKYRNKLLKGISSIHKLTEKGSSIFMYALTKGDVSVAERSWAAYYLKALKDAGVDLKTVDLSTEHLKQDDKVRQEAAAYAEQKVKETQVVSNPAELAKLLRTSQGAENWIKNIFLPFSTFSVNTKVRLIENLRQLRTNPDKAEAYRALAGTISEVALYSTIKYFILSGAYKLLRDGLRNLFDLEPEDEEDNGFKFKQWYSAIYKDFFPFAVGAGENASIEFANMIAYAIEHPDSSYDEWKKENKGGRFYQYKKKESTFGDLGLYSVGLDRVSEAVSDSQNLYKATNGEPVVTSTPWGEKESNLDSDQRKFLAFMTMLDFMSGLGLMDAGFYNQVKKVYKDQLKDKKPTSSNRILPRPLPRPLPIPK